MQLVTQFIDPSDATAANSRLRKAGVMTEITSLDPHIMSGSRIGALRIGLWVVFEDQFDDAVQLLEDPDHVPHRVISLSEMHKIKSTSRDSWLESGKKNLANLATMIFATCLPAWPGRVRGVDCQMTLDEGSSRARPALK